MPYVEFDVGVVSSSQLNQQFYEKMKKCVWKITVEDRTYNGVCVCKGNSNFIITTWFKWNEDATTICVSSPRGKLYTPVYVHQFGGLSLLKLKFDKRPTFKAKRVSSSIDAGSSFYSITYGPKSISPIFFKGMCAFPFYSDPSRAHLNRTPAKLCSTDIDIPLSRDTSLIQVQGLAVGFESGVGSPVFNANGHLVGIVAFEYSNWNMVIPSSYIQALVESFKKLRRATHKKKH